MKEYKVRLVLAGWEPHVEEFDVCPPQSADVCMMPGGFE